MKLKALLVILLFTVAPIVSACRITEVQDLFIVRTMGIDTAPGGKLKLTVLVINPGAQRGGTGGGGGGGRAQAAYHSFSQTGSSIFEIIRNMTSEAPRKLYFAHCESIIVREALLKSKGAAKILDFLERNTEIRPTIFLLVTNTPVDKILNVPSPLVPSPADRINKLIKEQYLSAHWPEVNIIQFARRLQTPGQEPFAPKIQVVANPPDKVIPKAEIERGELLIPKSKLKIGGTTIFLGNKPVASLNEDQTLGFLLARNEVEGGTFIVKYPDEEVTLTILKAQSRIQPVIQEDNIGFNIEVKISTQINELHSDLDPTDPAQVKGLEQTANKKVTSLITSALEVTREHGADAFGLGRQLHQKHPHLWKQVEKEWPDFYPDMPVEIKVETTVSKTGLTITKAGD